MVEYRSLCFFRNKSEFPDLFQQNLKTLEKFHLMEITKFYKIPSKKASKQDHIGTNDDLLLGTYVTALASQCLYFIVDLTSQGGSYISNVF